MLKRCRSVQLWFNPYTDDVLPLTEKLESIQVPDPNSSVWTEAADLINRFSRAYNFFALRAGSMLSPLVGKKAFTVTGEPVVYLKDLSRFLFESYGEATFNFCRCELLKENRLLVGVVLRRSTSSPAMEVIHFDAGILKRDPAKGTVLTGVSSFRFGRTDHTPIDVYNKEKTIVDMLVDLYRSSLRSAIDVERKSLQLIDMVAGWGGFWLSVAGAHRCGSFMCYYPVIHHYFVRHDDFRVTKHFFRASVRRSCGLLLLRTSLPVLSLYNQLKEVFDD